MYTMVFTNDFVAFLGMLLIVKSYLITSSVITQTVFTINVNFLDEPMNVKIIFTSMKVKVMISKIKISAFEIRTQHQGW